MRSWFRTCLPLLALLALLVPARAQEGGAGQEGRAAFERELKQVFEGNVARLVEHAGWCRASKLHGTRLEVLRAILALDPDHAEARKELGYRRDKDGAWIAPRNPRAQKDANLDALEEETRRRAEVATRLRVEVLELLEVHAKELTVRSRRRALAQVLEVLPDDAVLRGLLGESRDQDRWVLAETLRARKVRSELRPLVERLLEEAAATVERAEPTDRERAFGLPLVGAWSIPGLRVVATTDEAEALRTAAALGAARPLFDAIFRVKAAYRHGATTFLLGTPEQGRAWIERHPALDAAQRAFMGALQGSPVPYHGDIGAWAVDSPQRVDQAARMVLSGFLYDSLGVTMNHGLLSEGIGLYLTRELVGTRLTWFVQPSTYLRPADDLRLRNMLRDAGTNWMNEAHKLLGEAQSPKLQFLLGKPVSDLGTEDLLVAYVTAAYLIEAWPDELPGLLRAIGKGGTPQVIFEEHLGYDVVELDARLRRWLGERR